FALLEVAEVPRDGSLAPLFVNLPAPRLMMGVIDRHHIAAFAMAESVDAVRERLALMRRELQSRLVVQRAAELVYEDPIPRMEPDRFAARAREVLAHAEAERKEFLAIDSTTRR